MRLVSAWTGGQYSVFRLVFGAVLALRFVGLLRSPLDAPALTVGLLGFGLLLSLCLALGVRDRIAALALWAVSVVLVARDPVISR